MPRLRTFYVDLPAPGRELRRVVESWFNNCEVYMCCTVIRLSTRIARPNSNCLCEVMPRLGPQPPAARAAGGLADSEAAAVLPALAAGNGP